MTREPVFPAEAPHSFVVGSSRKLWGIRLERYRPYFSFSGRINRQPYWLTALALVPAYLVAFLLAVFIPVLGPLAAAILVIGGGRKSVAAIYNRQQ